MLAANEKTQRLFIATIEIFNHYQSFTKNIDPNLQSLMLELIRSRYSPKMFHDVNAFLIKHNLIKLDEKSELSYVAEHFFDRDQLWKLCFNVAQPNTTSSLNGLSNGLRFTFLSPKMDESSSPAESPSDTLPSSPRSIAGQGFKFEPIQFEASKKISWGEALSLDAFYEMTSTLYDYYSTCKQQDYNSKDIYKLLAFQNNSNHSYSHRNKILRWLNEFLIQNKVISKPHTSLKSIKVERKTFMTYDEVKLTFAKFPKTLEGIAQQTRTSSELGL